MHALTILIYLLTAQNIVLQFYNQFFTLHEKKKSLTPWEVIEQHIQQPNHKVALHF